MKKIFLSFLFILFFIQFNYCQQFYIGGKIEELYNQPIFLANVYGEKFNIIDTTFTNDTGYFAFQVTTKNKPGIYKILFKDNFSNQIAERALNIIFNNENVYLTTKYTTLYNDIKIIYSEENKIYYDFLINNMNHFNTVSFYRNKINYYTPADTFYSRLVKEYNKQQVLMRNYNDELVEKNKNKIVSKIIKAYKIPFIEGYLSESQKIDELKKYYFENIDFNEPILLRCSIYPDRILEYFSLFRDPYLTKKEQDSAWIVAIDKVLTLAFINEEVYNWVLPYVVNIAEKWGRDDIMKHIAKYVDENKCHNEQLSEVEMKLAKYTEFTAGKKIPNIQFKDFVTGKQVHLYDIKAKYTLIVFWASFCSHCTQSLPKLKEIYDKYDRNYFQIIAISVDNEREMFEDMLEEKGYNAWYNICDFVGWKTEFAKMFNVNFTPNTFLLDKNKVLISKPEIEPLGEFLETHK